MSSDTDIYKKQNFGNRLGMGRKPALLNVDFVNGFNNPNLFGGGNIDAAVKRTVGLLETCRDLKLPIAHTRIVFAEDGSDHNIMCMKVPQIGILTEDAPEAQIVPELTPKAGEIVVRKRFPSAFFATDLAALWTMQRVDTILVTGCTTSGCVRASVLDAMCWGFRPVVVTDCCGDRAIGPHDANLFDLGQKYADLMSRDEVIAELTAQASAQAAE